MFCPFCGFVILPVCYGISFSPSCEHFHLRFFFFARRRRRSIFEQLRNFEGCMSNRVMDRPDCSMSLGALNVRRGLYFFRLSTGKAPDVYNIDCWTATRREL